MTTSSLHRLLRLCLVAAALALLPTVATARVRLENLCTLQGQQEVRLTGFGLVVGLPGTGDGAKNLPTVRALRAALARMNQPTGELDVKNGDNVAVVLIEATIPKTGLRRGQKVDGFISTILGAKSLRGGRLLSTPLTSTTIGDDTAVALAGGAVTVEDIQRPTTGRLMLGVDLLADVTTLFMNQIHGDSITLLIDPNRASFWTSSEVARVVNAEFKFEAGNRMLARSTGPGSVEVTILPQYRDSPVDFVAQVLEIAIDVPHTAARVVLNPRSGTIVVTGEVEVSPVVISHKSFTVEVGAIEPVDAGGPFVAFKDGQMRQSPQQLDDLIKALRQLRVPTADIIAIIRELHASGKLHAELIDK